MFSVTNDNISITKGDSACIHVDLINADGSAYEMVEGDKLTLTVRRKVDSDVLMQIDSDNSDINLYPSDTAKLLVGGCFFDVQLTTSAGDVFTIAGATSSIMANMTVYPEITVGGI